MDSNCYQYSPYLQKIIQERSKHSKEERISSSKECISQLQKLNKPSYDGALEALKGEL